MARSARPVYGWSRTASDEFPERRDQRLRPAWSQVWHLIPLCWRYALHWLGRWWAGRHPPIDQIRMRHGRAIYGVPAGGVGSGTIGRGFRGEFGRFQMAPGLYAYAVLWANAFHVSVKRVEDGPVLFQSVLASRHSESREDVRGGARWDYLIRDEDIHYHALYPRAWSTFRIPQLELTLVCQQTSPFLPHDYRDSCLPVTHFEWTVQNDGPEPLLVTVAFTWQNGWGAQTDSQLNATVHELASDPAWVGVEMQQSFRDLRLSYGLGARAGAAIQAEIMDSFDPVQEDQAFVSALKGETSRTGSSRASPARICMALKARVTCQSEASSQLEFVLCWDMPQIQFGGRAQTWTRRYAQSVGSSQTQSGCTQLIRATLDRVSAWNAKIEAWQQSVLGDSALPGWFKSAVFNELYYIADGGTQWLDMKDSDLSASDPRREFGRFGYLESHEYRLYNTYDVHFYASFALMGLFPALQLSLQADFCDATAGEDPTRVWELYSGKWVKLNRAFSVPHDLGDPEDEPWIKVNAYRIHDVSDWKDLNLKFVISIWRDLVWGAERPELAEYVDFIAQKAYPICEKVMEASMKWDTDQDGLIENGGKPDQTFDSWVMSGPSAYCCGLWISALASMAEFSRKLGHESESEKWQRALKVSIKAFESKLWDPEGKFFRFDLSTSGCNTVMSDQLCGFWYSKLIGSSTTTLDETKVKLALDTIFRLNVKKYGDGLKGAVNGMLFDKGERDRSTVQSEEIWTGVTYGLASLMIAMGQSRQGFMTAEGIYRTVYESIGQGFETPEALYTEKNYRAIGYMRPLSIWSMYQAWERFKNDQT